MFNLIRALIGLVLLSLCTFPRAEILGPEGSVAFGTHVLVLPNGNVAVTDPLAPGQGGVDSAGAVYLYSPQGELVSRLSGSQALDQVGSGGLTAIPGRNAFFVHSPLWANQSVARAGAVTWIDGEVGLQGTVSAGNSVVGSSMDDRVGRLPLTFLAGNHVVLSEPRWDNGASVDAGAVRILPTDAPSSGALSAQNALVGSSSFDRVGQTELAPLDLQFQGFRPLPDGSVLVMSPFWSRLGWHSVGAVTRLVPGVGPVGAVGEHNSLVGSFQGSVVGFGANNLAILEDGSAVLAASSWSSPEALAAGAVIRIPAGTSPIGEINSSRALTGAQAQDRVGFGGVFALPGGAFMVLTPSWANGEQSAAGAATFFTAGSDPAGMQINASNSLIGTQAGDAVGEGGLVQLANGNLVVLSPFWDNGPVPRTGAVTWMSGTQGLTGEVSPQNSLVGNGAESRVGDSGVYALPSGNYLVAAPAWSDGSLTELGAVAWGNGNTGSSGVIGASSAIVGSSAGDRVGSGGISVLADGSALVLSPEWNNGGAAAAGAATWIAGMSPVSGLVSPSNSLLGTAAGDGSSMAIHRFASGGALLLTPNWSSGAGAITVLPVGAGRSGAIGPSVSLVGAMGDRLGFAAEHELPLGLADGSALVLSSLRTSQGRPGAGAVHRMTAAAASGELMDASVMQGNGAFDHLGAASAAKARPIALPRGGFVLATPRLTHPLSGDAVGGITRVSTNDPAGIDADAANTVFGRVSGDIEDARLHKTSSNTYVVHLPRWNEAGAENAGRVLWFDGDFELDSTLPPSAGAVGSRTDELGAAMDFSQINWSSRRLYVGAPLANRVHVIELLRGELFSDGFEAPAGMP